MQERRASLETFFTVFFFSIKKNEGGRKEMIFN
jgi:hypothetical protein